MSKYCNMPEAVGINHRAAGRSPRLSILLPRPTRPRIRVVLNLINYPFISYMSSSTQSDITLLEWADRMIHLFEKGSLPRTQWFNRANNVFVRLPKSELYSDRTDNVPCSLLAVWNTGDNYTERSTSTIVSLS